MQLRMIKAKAKKLKTIRKNQRKKRPKSLEQLLFNKNQTEL